MKKNALTRILITVIILVGAFVLIGSVLSKNKKKNEIKTGLVAATNNAISVKTHTVSRRAVDLDFVANGNFLPGQQLNFPAENSGRVVKVLVEEGSAVKKGQTLAIINTETLNIDLETAQAAYLNAKRDLERFENAFATGGVTKQQLDQQRLNYENARARVNQAKIRVGDAYIKSSINGVVNKKFIEPGAVVAPGTQLFEIVNVAQLKLKVNVNEAQVALLKVGDKVKVKASVLPDKTFTGRISFIAVKADQALNFPVEIEIDNPGNALKAGMYATAYFDFPGLAPVLVAPRSAFVGGVNSNEVFVMKADSTVVLQKVVSGKILGDQVEILDGLQEHDVIITSGQINLTNGSKVAPIQ